MLQGALFTKNKICYRQHYYKCKALFRTDDKFRHKLFFKYCIGDAICQKNLNHAFVGTQRKKFLEIDIFLKNKMSFSSKTNKFFVATEFTISLSRKDIRETQFWIFCSISLEQSHTKYETQNTVTCHLAQVPLNNWV